MEQKKQGVIKHYNSEKGYGFIKAEDGEEYFFRFSALSDWPEGQEPQVNVDQVEFEVETSDRGPRAANVVLLEGGAETTEETAA